MDPHSGRPEGGAAPEARRRAGVGWAALVAGIVTALVIVLLIWLLA